jgi:hypothetical protein
MAVPCGMPVSLKIASVCRSNTHYLSIFHIVSPDLSHRNVSVRSAQSTGASKTNCCRDENQSHETCAREVRSSGSL